MTTDRNPHAFPLITRSGEHFNQGLTTLDYFAARAMPAIILHPGAVPGGPAWAKEAYDIAEAMLAERDKRNK